MFYDPLVSKLSVWAPTRELAVQRMARALEEYVIAGIKTNIPFHLRLMRNSDFVRGHYDTGFIERNKDGLLKGQGAGEATKALFIGAAVAQAFVDAQAARKAAASAPSPTNGHGNAISPWRMGGLARM